MIETIYKEFSFLTDKYGFECGLIDNWTVKYTLLDKSISVIYDGSRSYEVDVLFEKEEELNSFHLSEFFQYFNESFLLSYMINETSNIECTMHDISKHIKSHISEYINDPHIFKSLAEQRKINSDKYYIDNELTYIREQATKAWKQRDYMKIVKLFSSKQQYLTSSEVKKLTYAKKMLS